MKRPYSIYRDSGVEWLGVVPEHWGVRRLRHICQFAYGDSLPSDTRQSGEVPVFGSNGAVGYHDEPNTLAPVIVIGRKGSHGQVNFYDGSAFAIDTTYFVDERHTTADLRWLYFALPCTELADESLDSAVPGLSREHAYGKHLAVPPLAEQRSMAAFLDREAAKIDTLISKKRLLLDRLAEFRTALITRTVTKGLPPAAAQQAGLNPNSPLKASGVEWLGEVPEHWGVARLKWSATGSVNGVWGDEPNGEDDVICVRVADFDRRGLRASIASPTMRAVPLSQREGRELTAGDLLIEKSGGGEQQLVGCVVLYDHSEPAVCSNFIARVSIAEDAEPRYWTYMHAAIYSGRLNYPAIKQTTGIQNLDAHDYFDTPTVFPPLGEQRHIADFLDEKTRRIEALCSTTELAIERLQEYRTALITAAVTGKIDVRDREMVETGASRT